MKVLKRGTPSMTGPVRLRKNIDLDSKHLNTRSGSQFRWS